MTEINYKKQGKRNKINGADFERRVRTDLESKGWTVAKWTNNVEFIDHYEDEGFKIPIGRWGKCIPAKRKYNPFKRAYSVGTGFPDFIAYTFNEIHIDISIPPCETERKEDGSYRVFWNNQEKIKKGNQATIIFIECKINGYLDKQEKAKAKWYLENGYCSKFLIASKIKEKNKIKIKYIELK